MLQTDNPMEGYHGTNYKTPFLKLRGGAFHFLLMAGVVRMEKNNQNHEEYPICFLSDFLGAGKDLRDTLTKDVDKYILSTGGVISLTKLANKLCDPAVQGKTNRTWTINDYRVFESVLLEIGYKICKEYDKKGRLKVAYITR